MQEAQEQHREDEGHPGPRAAASTAAAALLGIPYGFRSVGDALLWCGRVCLAQRSLPAPSHPRLRRRRLRRRRASRRRSTRPRVVRVRRRRRRTLDGSAPRPRRAAALRRHGQRWWRPRPRPFPAVAGVSQGPGGPRPPRLWPGWPWRRDGPSGGRRPPSQQRRLRLGGVQGRRRGQAASCRCTGGHTGCLRHGRSCVLGAKSWPWASTWRLRPGVNARAHLASAANFPCG
mmetsp:Transcript_12819/g.39964  ORF Transcript_12819/g.39964 Transcript_12819/m.39964 type:complete len:231 (+) Transcript_12819:510-1202(+)